MPVVAVRSGFHPTVSTQRIASALRWWLPCLLAGLGAAIPIIHSAVKAVRAGWVPAGDDGIIATRGWDVLTAHTPLVGQYSEAGLVIRGQVMHSPARFSTGCWRFQPAMAASAAWR
jgi:hypothetical protein